jgi:hypothetical protein
VKCEIFNIISFNIVDVTIRHFALISVEEECNL